MHKNMQRISKILLISFAFICSDSIGFAFTKQVRCFLITILKNRLINTKGIDYLAQKDTSDDTGILQHKNFINRVC